MRILIGINTLNNISQVIYVNHMHFFYRLAKQHPDFEFMFFAPPRMSIDRMRNLTARTALEHKCDYILFIDDDVLIPLETLKYLLKPDYDIIAGNVVIRGYPYNAMFFKSDAEGNLHYYNDYKEHIKIDGVLDCDAVGFSCCLINCKILTEIEPPYFVTGPFNTEDIYFCIKIRQALPNALIGVVPEISCGHLGSPRIFSPETVEINKTFDEAEDATLEDKLKERFKRDRGDKYIQEALEAFK